MTVNFGPQHPAAHGVLRLIIELDGEIVCFVDPHIGLLHRGSEKLIESKNAQQALPYFDRFDYVSMMSQEHVFSVAIERLFDKKISLKIQYIRVLFLELTRILNHLLAVTTHALDVGALTPFLWGFEEREKIMYFYESVSGARMHASYIRPGGISQDLPLSLLHEIQSFIERCEIRINELDSLLLNNRIWKSRLENIGIVSKDQCFLFGFSGVMLRGSGISFDLRKHTPYEVYDQICFNIPVGIKGDCFDRYRIRILEALESCKIVKQCCFQLLHRFFPLNFDSKFNFPLKSRSKLMMEDLIHHFKLSTEGLHLPFDFNYFAAEAPKGEFGVFLQGNSSSKIFRCRVRAPGFFHLQSLADICRGAFLADLVTVIGTQDIVFGEIDR
jgi:NADH dehydrogenase I D subunit